LESSTTQNLEELANLFGVDISTIKQEMRKAVLEAVQSQFEIFKEQLKEEVKQDLIKEAEEKLKNVKIPVQPIQQAQAQAQGDGSDVFRGLMLAKEILGGGSQFEKMMQAFMQMQLVRMMRSATLADAAMDKVYKKILGKEFDKITKEIATAFEEMGEEGE
jgi:hypothetical protein